MESPRPCLPSHPSFFLLGKFHYAPSTKEAQTREVEKQHRRRAACRARQSKNGRSRVAKW